MISLIAAIGKNNELGKGNDLVWRLPADQKFFREKTSGHPIIMGRKTFESLPGILPKRKHIIITRDKNYSRAGIDIVNSLEGAIRLAKESEGGDEIFIIGGAEIFKQSINIADRLYITHIHGEDKKADTFFPEIIPIAWNEVSRIDYKKDEKHPFDYTFSVYERFI